ncbi:MAG TPA: hypothetical protein DCP63_09310 [Bacteroidetes bacterium]|nr:hypothetical protein [Bacteroidota bacterium]
MAGGAKLTKRVLRQQVPADAIPALHASPDDVLRRPQGRSQQIKLRVPTQQQFTFGHGILLTRLDRLVARRANVRLPFFDEGRRTLLRYLSKEDLHSVENCRAWCAYHVGPLVCDFPVYAL